MAGGIDDLEAVGGLVGVDGVAIKQHRNIKKKRSNHPFCPWTFQTMCGQYQPRRSLEPWQKMLAAWVWANGAAAFAEKLNT
jgi:hypothetical protein